MGEMSVHPELRDEALVRREVARGLGELLARWGGSDEALARRLGFEDVPRGAFLVGAWSRGDEDPDEAQVARLCDAVGAEAAPWAEVVRRRRAARRALEVRWDELSKADARAERAEWESFWGCVPELARLGGAALRQAGVWTLRGPWLRVLARWTHLHHVALGPVAEAWARGELVAPCSRCRGELFVTALRWGAVEGRCVCDSGVVVAGAHRTSGAVGAALRACLEQTGALGAERLEDAGVWWEAAAALGMDVPPARIEDGRGRLLGVGSTGRSGSCGRTGRRWCCGAVRRCRGGIGRGGWGVGR